MGAGGGGGVKGLGLYELEIPRAVVLRKIKQAVGWLGVGAAETWQVEGKPVQKDAKVALTKATTVFISYLTAAANDSVTLSRSGKTLTALQVTAALESVGFAGLIGAVQKRTEGTSGTRDGRERVEHQAAAAEKAARKTAHEAEAEAETEGVEDHDHDHDHDHDQEQEQDEDSDGDGDDGGYADAHETDAARDLFQLGRTDGHGLVDEANMPASSPPSDPTADANSSPSSPAALILNDSQ